MNNAYGKQTIRGRLVSLWKKISSHMSWGKSKLKVLPPAVHASTMQEPRRRLLNELSDDGRYKTPEFSTVPSATEQQEKQPNNELYFYHTTSLKNLFGEDSTQKSIQQQGLLRQCGANNAIIGDRRKAVFFSEGIEGAILLFMTLYDTYTSGRNDEQGVLKMYTEVLAGREPPYDRDRLHQQACFVQRCQKASNFRDYLGKNVYLCFPGGNIVNRGNFIDGYTSEADIPSNQIKVCTIFNNSNGKVLSDSFDVVDFWLAKTDRECIMAKLNELNNNGRFDDRVQRIARALDSYISDHEDRIRMFKQGNFTLKPINIQSFKDKLEETEFTI